jgi:two-component system nitrogen regulation response regulator GlnG
MPLSTQAKILRLLQEQSFERVGGNETVRTDVRLIAATNRDLKADSAEGKFRLDLYYRLSVFTIRLPALRERGDDLPMLVQHYLRRFSAELGRQVQEITPEALDRLSRYPWPGNIRELQGVLKQAILQASGTVLIPAFLPEGLGISPEPEASEDPETAADFRFASFIQRRLEEGSTTLSAEAHQLLDRMLLRLALRQTGGNQVHAARAGHLPANLARQEPGAGVGHPKRRPGRSGRKLRSPIAPMQHLPARCPMTSQPCSTA